MDAVLLLVQLQQDLQDLQDSAAAAVVRQQGGSQQQVMS
jgi:hypothetical protein